MNRDDIIAFHSFNKIDAHLHFNIENSDVLDLANKHRFALISVNVEYDAFGSIKDQYQVAQKLYSEYPEQVKFITTFPMKNWESPEWLADTLTKIEHDLQQGALGVKIWKNIGMEIRDSKGLMLFIDDPRLDPFFTYLEDHGYPVMMHQAEPKNCWLPLEKMTMEYDRQYFSANPNYHMFRHKELPSYQQLLDARDRRLAKNPELITIQAHLASLEWSVDALAEFLDRFPNTVVDTAARMNHLMLQARDDWQRVRAFFVKYQNRILYATDFFITPDNKKSAAPSLEALWLRDWQFLAGNSEMKINEFDGSFKGLELPEDVLRNIYLENATRVFKHANIITSEILYA